MTVFYNRPYTIAYYGIPLTIPSEDYRYVSLDDTGNIRLHKSNPVIHRHYFSAEGDHLFAGFRADTKKYEFQDSLVELNYNLSKLYYLMMLFNNDAPREYIGDIAKFCWLMVDDYNYLVKHWIGRLSEENKEQLRKFVGLPESTTFSIQVEIPYWAKYMATNKNGNIWVFSEKPTLHEDDGVWLADENAHAKKVSYTADAPFWANSLTEL